MSEVVVSSPPSVPLGMASSTTVEKDEQPHTYTYVELDHPKYAVHSTCFDITRLRKHPGAQSASIWLHHKRPTVFVHIVGRVVAVDEREKKVMWIVDDGSAAIAVHHRLKEARRPRVEKFKAPVSAGIPSDYVRPPTPPPEEVCKVDEVLKEVEDLKEFQRYISHIDLFSLVSVFGRLEKSFESMSLRVDRVVPLDKDKDDPMVRSLSEGYLEVWTNPNAEWEHLLRTMRLAEGEYQKVCDEATGSLDQLPFACGQGGKREAPDSPPRPKLKKLILATTERTPSPPRRRLQMLGEVKRPSHRQSAPQERQTDKVEAAPIKALPAMPTPVPPTQSAILTTVAPRAEPVAEVAQPRVRSRKLRDFRKLPDDELTDQTMCIYVQKHINDWCRSSLSSSSSSSTSTEEPPAFTIAYLMRVSELRKLAYRITELILRRRQKQRAKAGQTTAPLTSEAVADKVERLFEFVIRSIVADGVVVIADGSTPPTAPYNGKRPTKPGALKRVDPEKLLDWIDVVDDSGGDGNTASSGDSSMTGNGRAPPAPMQCEAYQAVTPALLAHAVAKVLRLDPLPAAMQPKNAPPEPSSRNTARLGTSAHAVVVGGTAARGKHPAERAPTHLIAAAIDTLSTVSTERVYRSVRALDGRWQRILVESVREAMHFLRQLYKQELEA